MNQIYILSESAGVGNRLHEIIYQAGYADTFVPNLEAFPELRQNGILIIYAKSHISDMIQNAVNTNYRVILLLNPDFYALYLDRARHAGIKLLLMPVAPYVLLDAIKELTVIS